MAPDGCLKLERWYPAQVLRSTKGTARWLLEWHQMVDGSLKGTKWLLGVDVLDRLAFRTCLQGTRRRLKRY